MTTLPEPEKPSQEYEGWLRLGYTLGIVTLFGIGCGSPAVSVFFLDTWHRYNGEECLTEWPWVLFSTAWWANPFLALGCGLLWAGRYRGAVVAGGIASLLGLTALCWRDLRVEQGYWFWLWSMSLLILAGYHGAMHRWARGEEAH